MRKGGKSHMELDDLLKLIDHVSKSKLDDFCYETGAVSYTHLRAHETD